MLRSMRWAARCQAAAQDSGTPAAVFGIVQGGMHAELRQQSVEMLEEPGLSGIGNRRTLGG